MLDKLKLYGTKIDEGTVEALLESRKESFFHLAQFVTSGNSWDNTSIHPWSPYCALSILAKMRHHSALLAITTAILNYSEYANDWIIENAPGQLAHMGPDAIPSLTALMQYNKAPIRVRISVEIALLMIATGNPETKHRIIESIKSCAMDEPDIKMRDEILGCLLYMDEPEIHEYLNELIEKESATEGCYNLYDCYNDDGGMDFGYFLDEKEDPLHYIRYNSGIQPPDAYMPSVYPLSIYGKSSGRNPPKETSKPKQHQVIADSHTERLPHKPKVARNDPCICGSGKKYKKCCLSITQT